MQTAGSIDSPPSQATNHWSLLFPNDESCFPITVHHCLSHPHATFSLFYAHILEIFKSGKKKKKKFLRKTFILPASEMIMTIHWICKWLNIVIATFPWKVLATLTPSMHAHTNVFCALHRSLFYPDLYMKFLTTSLSLSLSSPESHSSWSSSAGVCRSPAICRSVTLQERLLCAFMHACTQQVLAVVEVYVYATACSWQMACVNVGSDTSAYVCVSAAYPAAYGQISQAFPQPPPIIPQQQREGETQCPVDFLRGLQCSFWHDWHFLDCELTWIRIKWCFLSRSVIRNIKRNKK